jgi:hypothetical protein
MVLKIPPDPRQIAHDVDAQRSEVRGWTYTGEHEDLRRIVCASTDNNLAPGRDRLLTATPPKDRAGATRAAQDESLDGRIDEDGEVGTRCCRWQVADGGAAAFAIALRNLIKAETLLVAGWPNRPSGSDADLLRFK